MKIKLTVFVLFLTAFVALAQIPVPEPPAATPPGALLLTIIPLLVPILVAVGKSILPKVPTWLLPILAPALGALIDYIGSLATHGGASPLAAALAGSAGVGIRELTDQIKQRIQGGPKPTTP